MNTRFLLTSLAPMFAMPLAAATFVVTTTADAGLGSLRWAIQQANAQPGADVILFNIPGVGPHTIVPLSPLQALTDPAGVLIDGLSQLGASAGASPPRTATLLIELDGTMAGLADGILVHSDNNIVRGLVVNRFQASGIHIEGPAFGTADHNLVFCNFVGTDPAGALGLGNGLTSGALRGGIQVGNVPFGFARDNTIDANLSSDNWSEGVWIEGPRQPGDVGYNHITRNFVGTDRTGKQPLGNHHEGVALTEGTHDNDVVSCLISANGTDGVGIQGFDNLGFGPPLQTSRNLVASNLIGVDIDILPLPNTLHGVAIGQYGPARWGHADANTIRDNVIANNGGDGVAVVEVFTVNTSNADGNQISRNAMWNNGGLGIDLDDDGPTGNDPGDLDFGADQQLNHPVITGISYATATAITGAVAIDTNPALARVEVFLAKVDPLGQGEGEWYLGSATPDAAGNWVFTTDRLAPGDVVTANVTDVLNNTSEFSPNQTVPGTPSLTTSSHFFPARLGGVCNFGLDSGSAQAGRLYLVAGSMSGSMPGIPLGSVTVPLNPDWFTFALLGVVNSQVCPNCLGILDANGRAQAQLNLLGVTNPSWAGTVMHFAFLLPFDVASNPVAVEIMPW